MRRIPWAKPLRLVAIAVVATAGGGAQAQPLPRTLVARGLPAAQFLRFSPDGYTFAAAGADGVIELWPLGKDSSNDIGAAAGYPKQQFKRSRLFRPFRASPTDLHTQGGAALALGWHVQPLQG